MPWLHSFIIGVPRHLQPLTKWIEDFSQDIVIVVKMTSRRVVIISLFAKDVFLRWIISVWVVNCVRARNYNFIHSLRQRWIA